MPNSTTKFFEDLGRREDDGRLRNAVGTVRFEIVDNDQAEYWLVAMKKGDLTVSRGEATDPCDCVVRADAALFADITRGEENAMTAMLRGALSAEGNLELLWWFQRLLPAPASSAEQIRVP